MIRAYFRKRKRIKFVNKKIAEMLNDIADAFVGQTKSNVEKGKDINMKSFAPLADSTKEAKRKKGSRFPNKPLMDSGLMRKVFRSKSASASSLESRVGVAQKRKEIAQFHNDGGDNLPKREWFGIGTKTERRINQMIRAKMKTIVRL